MKRTGMRELEARQIRMEETRQTGKLYGVGVGPGDPELMTLKAVRVIEESQVVAVPGETAGESIAWQIAAKVCKKLPEKEILAVPMPMTKDRERLKASHEAGAAALEKYLDDGKQIAFLTLGDPSVYSTYIYLHKRVEADGYPAELVSGVPSFCAAAARLGIGLAEQAESLHIIPASYSVEHALGLSGTKVLMKAGKKLSAVKAALLSEGKEAVMVENCGMPGEKTYRTAEEIPEHGSYYSIIVVKE